MHGHAYMPFNSTSKTTMESETWKIKHMDENLKVDNSDSGF